MVATTAGQALNELYTHDQMNQLTSMERGVLNTDGNTISNKTFGEQFTFDTTGNWLNYKRDANGDGTFEVDQTRTHNLANEILTISSGNTLVPHDRNGCMTKIPQPNSWSSTHTLVYDAWNRLISVSDGDTLVATYMYDARNHRIKTTVGTTVTLKYFNRNWQEVESVAAGVTTTYVYGLRYIDDIICRTSGSETLYALQDPNWNVVAVLNSNGSVAERITYDSFGRVTFRNASFVAKTTSSYSWTKTFTGQVYDSETGLMLYRNRYYHPTLGRFITRDPIGYNANDVNLYRYMTNTPLLGLDPTGEEPVTITTCIIIGLGIVFGIGGCSSRPEKYPKVKISFDGPLATVSIQSDCVIVLLYGHGGQEAHNIEFCGHHHVKGGFIGCYPGYTNQKIPQANQIDGLPMDYDFWLKPAAQKMKEKLLENARRQAKELVASGCCPDGVTIQTVAVGIEEGSIRKWGQEPESTEVVR